MSTFIRSPTNSKHAIQRHISFQPNTLRPKVSNIEEHGTMRLRHHRPSDGGARGGRTPEGRRRGQGEAGGGEGRGREGQTPSPQAAGGRSEEGPEEEGRGRGGREVVSGGTVALVYTTRSHVAEKR
ncbi:hypothetical protein BU23DRAFT_603788 [Bimuria novae-zelandiae CBS 107.79]|uniref:Uncharacterized protein n=1 Tax=Bimuria novae-zelandiae CBS 107.79 TaxID=1447943 RepID=A0A6A5UNX7_9PLEO|nr:hypothetical protein BU23DRAFT_603788 [Bimuria novae-zelandiae CBS 107.79]